MGTFTIFEEGKREFEVMKLVEGLIKVSISVTIKTCGGARAPPGTFQHSLLMFSRHLTNKGKSFRHKSIVISMLYFEVTKPTILNKI